jgi:hypothetical protein
MYCAFTAGLAETDVEDNPTGQTFIDIKDKQFQYSIENTFSKLP